MQEIKKLLKLNKVEYYETHLSLINCLLPVNARMTNMEIKVLARFMSIDLGAELKEYRFTSGTKKIVMKGLGITPAGLSNYLSSLTNKQFLRKSEDNVIIWPLLIPEENEQLYTFKLVNQGELIATLLPTNGSTNRQNGTENERHDNARVEAST